MKSKFEEMAKDEAAENKVDLEYLVVDVGVGKGEQVAEKCGVESKELERGPVVVLFKQGVKVRNPTRFSSIGSVVSKADLGHTLCDYRAMC